MSSDLTQKTLQTLDSHDLNQRFKDTYVSYKDEIVHVVSFDKSNKEQTIFFVPKEREKQVEPKKQKVVVQDLSNPTTLTGSLEDLARGRILPPNRARIVFLASSMRGPTLASFDSFIPFLGQVCARTSWWTHNSNRDVNNFTRQFAEAFGMDAYHWLMLMDASQVVELQRSTRPIWDIFAPGEWTGRENIRARLYNQFEVFKVIIRNHRGIIDLYNLTRRISEQLSSTRNCPVMLGAFPLLYISDRAQLYDSFHINGDNFTWLCFPELSNNTARRAESAEDSFLSKEIIKEKFDPDALISTRLPVGWYFAEKENVPYFVHHSTERQWHRGWCSANHPVLFFPKGKANLARVTTLSSLFNPYRAAFRNVKGRQKHQIKNFLNAENVILDRNFLKLFDGTLFYRTQRIGKLDLGTGILELNYPEFKQELEEILIQPTFKIMERQLDNELPPTVDSLISDLDRAFINMMPRPPTPATPRLRPSGSPRAERLFHTHFTGNNATIPASSILSTGTQTDDNETF
jgi:hypothetical protein